MAWRKSGVQVPSGPLLTWGFARISKDWSRSSDRQANGQLLPTAEFTQVPNAGHFIALERPDVPANLVNSAT
jgi:pimeloyl-ACP methyl ester carboxylesterase